VAGESRTITQSTVYNSIAVNSVTLFGALSSILVARYLGPVKTGVVSYAVWLAGLLGLAATLGLPGTITKYVSEYVGRGNTGAAGSVFRRLFVLESGTALAVLLLFLAEERVFGFFEASGLLPEVGTYFLTTACLMVLNAAILGMRSLKTLALQGIVVYPPELAALWFALARGAGVRAVLWVYVAGNLVAAGILLAALRKSLILPGPAAGLPPAASSAACPASPANPDWRKIKLYFLAVSGITIIDAVIWQRSEVLFLKKFSTDANVAFYHIAFGLSLTLVRTIGTALLGILLPFFSSYYGAEDTEGVRRLFGSSTRWLSFFTLPFVAAGTALGPEIILILYGRDYLPVDSVLFIMLLASAVGAIAGGGAALLYGVEKQNVILKIGAATAVLNLLLDFLLIPRFHLAGAAVANASAQILAGAIGLGYIIAVMKIRFPGGGVLKIALSSAVAFACMTLSKRLLPPYWGAVVAAAIGPLAFLGSVKLCAFYRPEDVRTLESVAALLPRPLGKWAGQVVHRIT
jgi:O-antigen/teichoic acid export membrane protein